MRLGLVGATPPSPHFYEGLRTPLPPPPPVADFDARQTQMQAQGGPAYSTPSSFGAQTGNPYGQPLPQTSSGNQSFQGQSGNPYGQPLPQSQSAYPSPYQQGGAPSYGHSPSFVGGGQFSPSPSFGGGAGPPSYNRNPSFGGGPGEYQQQQNSSSMGGGGVTYPPVIAYPPLGASMGGGNPPSLQQQQSFPQGTGEHASYPQPGGGTGGYPQIGGGYPSNSNAAGGGGYPSSSSYPQAPAAQGPTMNGRPVGTSLETRQANRPDVPEPLYLCPITQVSIPNPLVPGPADLQSGACVGGPCCASQINKLVLDDIAGTSYLFVFFPKPPFFLPFLPKCQKIAFFLPFFFNCLISIQLGANDLQLARSRKCWQQPQQST